MSITVLTAAALPTMAHAVTYAGSTRLGTDRCAQSCIKSSQSSRYVERYGGCRTRACVTRVRGKRRFPVREHLLSIAMCESHGNPRAVSGNGMYRGKYQFSYSTWQAAGGRGDPAAASEYEQDMRAERIYRRDGAGHWPVCAGR